MSGWADQCYGQRPLTPEVTGVSGIMSLDAAIDFNELLAAELEDLRLRLSKYHALMLSEVEEECDRKMKKTSPSSPLSPGGATKLGPTWQGMSALKSVTAESDIIWQEEDEDPDNRLTTFTFHKKTDSDKNSDLSLPFPEKNPMSLQMVEDDAATMSRSLPLEKLRQSIHSQGSEDDMLAPVKAKKTSRLRKTQTAGYFRTLLSMHHDEEELDLRSKAEQMSILPDRAALRTQDSSNLGWYDLAHNKQQLAASFLTHPITELSIAILILINSIVVGIEVDWTVRNPKETALPMGFSILGYMFNILFAIEVGLRMFALGAKFFTGGHRGWNIFDLSLVLASIVEVAIDLLYRTGDDTFDSNLHIVRMILGTLRSVFWAMVLLVVILYTFGMIFAQVASEHIADDDRESPSDLEKYWSTVPRSMFTLYKTITGGVDWEHVSLALSQIHWFWVAVFICFLSFTIFAVLNVVVGVFCQSAIQSASMDHENAVRMKINDKRTFTRKVEQLFLEIDATHDGTLTYHKLQAHLGDENVGAYFETLGIDSSDAWDLFKLLDKDASQRIDVDEFVEGCMRLRGPAKAMDAAKIMFESRLLRKQLANFKRQAESYWSSTASGRSPPLLPGDHDPKFSKDSGSGPCFSSDLAMAARIRQRQLI